MPIACIKIQLLTRHVLYTLLLLYLLHKEKRREKKTKFLLENNSAFFIGFVKTLIVQEGVNTRSTDGG